VAQEHTFDIVSRVDLQEVKNAIAQALKEVRQRFDFKGSRADIVLDEKERTLELVAEDDLKMRNLGDLLKEKLVKRHVPLKALQFGEPRPAAGSLLRQVVTLQHGIPGDKAKEIVKLLKASKLKVQASIQGDQLRVAGKNLDDLQSCQRLLREADLGIDMQFTNYR
jgi:hypothetical protein